MREILWNVFCGPSNIDGVEEKRQDVLCNKAFGELSKASGWSNEAVQRNGTQHLIQEELISSYGAQIFL